jgi:hypothetical protein
LKAAHLRLILASGFIAGCSSGSPGAAEGGTVPPDAAADAPVEEDAGWEPPGDAGLVTSADGGFV